MAFTDLVVESRPFIWLWNRIATRPQSENFLFTSSTPWCTCKAQRKITALKTKLEYVGEVSYLETRAKKMSPRPESSR